MRQARSDREALRLAKRAGWVTLGLPILVACWAAAYSGYVNGMDVQTTPGMVVGWRVVGTLVTLLSIVGALFLVFVAMMETYIWFFKNSPVWRGRFEDWYAELKRRA